VRFTDGTLDVRLLRVSNSTVCIGVARGGRGSGLEGLAPSMWAADTLFLCGSSASCLFQSSLVALLFYDCDVRRNDSVFRLYSGVPGKNVIVFSLDVARL